MITKIRRNNPQPANETDKAIGIAIIVLTALFSFGELALYFMGGVALSFYSDEMKPDDVETMNQVKQMLLLIMFHTVVVGLANVVVGIGVMKSMLWAFYVGIVMGLVNAIASLGHIDNLDVNDLALSGGIFLYCLLRLMGKIGAKPT